MTLRVAVDANLPPRIASELRKRGYLDAATTAAFGFPKSTLDPELIAGLAALDPGVVLVTYDNAMPVEHRDELKRHRLTLAIIDKDRRPDDLELLAYFHEVVHRHVHRIREQPAHSIFKYSTTPRRVEVKL